AKNTDLKIQRKIEDLWTSLGAKLLRVCAKTHDEALSYVSHLPHLAAFCLINVIPDGFLKFSSSGLKDTTRIAASEAGLWADIFLSNRKNMLKAISLFRKDLSWMSSLIDKNNKGILVKVLTKAKAKREGLD
ncbi:MAG: prephenate dehydrogenase, partial [Candidatus Omnitrophica bacterium]|nr:prephenate dehydrogenase [Candidatus Omnitrophota bacterium]